MKTQKVIKGIALGAAILTIAACSSTKNGGNAGGGIGGEGANGYGSQGAYAEGMGSGSGFYNTQNCDVPQSGGMKTQAYYFDFDSYAINSEDRSRLQNLAQSAAANSNIDVVGNTDNRGSREYNVALGWRRADAVASILKQYGASKITTNSNGAEKPIAYGNSEQDFQCNRRVDARPRG